MPFAFKNKAITYLDVPLSSGATNIIVGSGEGDKFPSPTGGQLSPLVLENRLTGAFEIVHMTGRAGDQLNVIRGQEGTLPQSWPVGSNLSARATAAVYDKFASYDARLQQNEADIDALEATTAAVLQLVVNTLYPVGSLYSSTLSTNPATILGFGTWVAHAEGRAIVGVGNNGQSTWTGGQARGSETHTLTQAEMPAHAHIARPPNAVSDAQGNHQHGGGIFGMPDLVGGTPIVFSSSSGSLHRASGNVQFAGIHQHNVKVPDFWTDNTGSSGAHNNIQPSIGIYIWRRTAL